MDGTRFLPRIFPKYYPSCWQAFFVAALLGYIWAAAVQQSALEIDLLARHAARFQLADSWLKQPSIDTSG